MSRGFEPGEFTIPSGRGTRSVVLTTDAPDQIDAMKAGDIITVLDRSRHLLHING